MLGYSELTRIEKPRTHSLLWLTKFRDVAFKCYRYAMQVTIDIPDTLAAQLSAAGKNPSRVALEALAVDGYRTRQLSESEVRAMLGYETRMQVHELLKEHGIYLNFSIEDFQQDIETSDRLFERSTAA